MCQSRPCAGTPRLRFECGEPCASCTPCCCLRAVCEGQKIDSQNKGFLLSAGGASRGSSSSPQQVNEEDAKELGTRVDWARLRVLGYSRKHSRLGSCCCVVALARRSSSAFGWQACVDRFRLEQSGCFLQGAGERCNPLIPRKAGKRGSRERGSYAQAHRKAGEAPSSADEMADGLPGPPL